MLNDSMYMAQKGNWGTPPKLFKHYNAIHNFDIDLAADDSNALCARYYTEHDNALRQVWRGVCWLNPPYGRDIKIWVAKAHDAAKRNGATVVCLLPARTDVTWFQDYALPYANIDFVRGRLYFVGSTNTAPFPSIVVTFTPATVKRAGGHTIASVTAPPAPRKRKAPNGGNWLIEHYGESEAA